MTGLAVIAWLVNMLCDTLGQLSFKAAAAHPGDGWARWRGMASGPWLWAGIGCFVVEFFAWLAFLSLVPLSTGVLLGSINIVLVMVAGRLLFGERITRLRFAGILLIAAGVTAVGGGKLMRRAIALGFLCLLGFDAMGQLSFKAAALAALPMSPDADWILRVLAEPVLYLAFLGYLGAFVTWMSLLKHAPIGPAFAASHLEVVAVMPLAALLFHEAIGWPQIVGAAAILAGILCLALEESESESGI